MDSLRNEQVLAATLEWGQELPGFTRAHAVHALVLAESFAGGLGWDARGLLLACLDLSCILWVDDWFDAREPASRGEGEAQALQQALLGGTATTPEALGLARLSARFRASAAHPDDHRLWTETLLDVLRASREDQRVSREQCWPRWGEYLENGEHNIAVAHTVFALSLAYGLGLAARAAEPRFRRALRNLCLAMRLRNDLASADKERREGNRANGVFLMEQSLPPALAFAFVDAERLGYERMLAADLEALGPSHPFPRVARVMSAAVERFYQVPNSRYGAS
jgi:hypothetical protein